MAIYDNLPYTNYKESYKLSNESFLLGGNYENYTIR